MTETPDSASIPESLPRTLFDFGWSFYKHSLIALFTIGVVSVPAVIVTHFGYPKALNFLVLAVFSCGIHLAAMYVRENHGESHDSFEKEKGDLQEAAILVSGMIFYFTPVMLITALIASRMSALGVPALVPLLFALYYPVLDFKTIAHYKKSPGGIPLILFFSGLHHVDVIEVPSLDEVLEDLLYKPTTLEEVIDDLFNEILSTG